MRNLGNVLNLIVTNIFGAIYIAEFVNGNIDAPLFGWLLIIAIILAAAINDMFALKRIAKKLSNRRAKHYLAKQMLFLM